MIMTRQYFILVDKRDSEKFRKFKIGKFNDATKQILQKNNCKFIWSFHEGHIKKDVWKKIRKNDFVYFSIPKNNFEVVAQISQKIIDKKLGKLLWPDSLDSEQITYFLLFKNLEKINFPYYKLTDNSTSKIIIHIPGIYEINKEFQRRLVIHTKKEFSDTDILLKPKMFDKPKFTKGMPEKNKSEVYRFVRDSSRVMKLKQLYDNKCQICDYRFEYKKNKFYSEVHHYNPLEENGNDDIDNMIVVCPNHHAEFDYKTIAIDRDEKTVIDKNGKKITEIYFHKDHKLSKKNILSQLRAK
jgi:hypothetical protein